MCVCVPLFFFWLEELYQCLAADINIKKALSSGKRNKHQTFFHPGVVWFTMGMFSVLAHADINNVDVSATIAKARISFLLVLCREVF